MCYILWSILASYNWMTRLNGTKWCNWSTYLNTMCLIVKRWPISPSYRSWLNYTIDLNTLIHHAIFYKALLHIWWPIMLFNCSHWNSKPSSSITFPKFIFCLLYRNKLHEIPLQTSLLNAICYLSRKQPCALLDVINWLFVICRKMKIAPTRWDILNALMQ